MIERYRLFVAKNDQVVLVDPNTRVVVDVVRYRWAHEGVVCDALPIHIRLRERT